MFVTVQNAEDEDNDCENDDTDNEDDECDNGDPDNDETTNGKIATVFFAGLHNEYRQECMLQECNNASLPRHLVASPALPRIYWHPQSQSGTKTGNDRYRECRTLPSLLALHPKDLLLLGGLLGIHEFGVFIAVKSSCPQDPSTSVECIVRRHDPSTTVECIVRRHDPSTTVECIVRRPK